MNTGKNGSALDRASVAPLVPRLLDLRATSAYLGLKLWTVRELEWAGKLRRVRLEGPHGREIRKLLFLRDDLDAYIDRCADDREPA